MYLSEQCLLCRFTESLSGAAEGILKAALSNITPTVLFVVCVYPFILIWGRGREEKTSGMDRLIAFYFSFVSESAHILTM